MKPPANFHGGDWRGIEDKIKDGYFKKLGVNTVWIAPLNINPAGPTRNTPNRTAGTPVIMATGRFRRPRSIRTSATRLRFNRSIKTAHEHGMKVIADLVLHHVHDGASVVERASRLVRHARAARMAARICGSGTSTSSRPGSSPICHPSILPKRRPITALIDNAIWWAKEYDLDGFRLDAVKHILPISGGNFAAPCAKRWMRKRDRAPLFGRRDFQGSRRHRFFHRPEHARRTIRFSALRFDQGLLRGRKSRPDQLEASLAASEETLRKGNPDVTLDRESRQGALHGLRRWRLARPEGIKEEEVGWEAPPASR